MKFASARFLAGFLATLVVAIAPANAQGPAFTDIIVFGESTSDTGNTWSLTEYGVWAGGSLPTEPVPPLYAPGRWSNGPMWIETLAPLLGENLLPPMPHREEGLNYAYTDARSGFGDNVRFSVWTGEPLLPPLVPSIGAQIELHGQVDDPTTLVILWVGANDVIFARQPQDISGAVRLIKTHIETLVNRGAKHILVPNQLDLSRAPAFSTLSKRERKALRRAVIRFNANLVVALSQLRTQYGDAVSLYPVNFFCLGEALLESDLNTTLPGALVWLEQSQDTGALAIDNPFFDNFVFWDTIHPTKAIHDLLAGAAANFILNNQQPQCPTR